MTAVAAAPPIGPELKATASSAYIQQVVDHLGKMILNDQGRWRGLGRRAMRSVNDRLHERNMKCEMNLKCCRKPQVDGAGVNNTFNGIGTNVSGCQLAGIS